MVKNTEVRKRSKTVKTIILFLLLVGIGLYIVTIICLYMLQDKILFGSPPLNVSRVALAKSVDPSITDLSLRMSDGTIVRGWKVNADESNKKPVIFYYGGNAEEVSSRLALAHEYIEFEWILINYRGYGASEGLPSEKVLFSDAQEAYQSFRDKEGFQGRKVFLFGQSLGTGVALSVAEKYPVTKIILATPYDSIEHVAQEQFPLFPITLLLSNRFRSVDIAPHITSPTLIIAAEQDTVIPTIHAQNLCDALGERCTYKVIAGVGHNDIVISDEYKKLIASFLEQ